MINVNEVDYDQYGEWDGNEWWKLLGKYVTLPI